VFTVSKSGDLSGIAKDLTTAAKKGQRDAGKAVAKEARTFILDDVRRARPRGLKMMGGRLGVKATTEATDVNSTVELRATPAGPWTIVTKGTRAYDIKPRRREVLAVGRGDVIGMSAHRRARSGVDYWTRATDRLDSELADVVERAVDKHMSKASG
jgi:hypothetical protein